MYLYILLKWRSIIMKYVFLKRTAFALLITGGVLTATPSNSVKLMDTETNKPVDVETIVIVDSKIRELRGLKITGVNVEKFIGLGDKLKESTKLDPKKLVDSYAKLEVIDNAGKTFTVDLSGSEIKLIPKTTSEAKK